MGKNQLVNMSLTFRIALVLLTLCGAAADWLGESSNSTLTLKKLIILSRHGIRVPYPASNLGQPTYSSFSHDGRAWPEDPKQWNAAGPQHLTNHGMLVLQEMGKYYSEQLQHLNWTRAPVVYADLDSSSRDIQTAANFMKGFGQPSVNILSNASCTKLLFNQGGTAPTDKCGLPTKEEVLGSIGGSIQSYTDQYRDVIMALNDATGCCNASVCNANDEQCTLMGIKEAFNPAAFWALFSGPLETGGTLAEFLALAYQNGMDLSAVVPGIDEYALSRLMEVHAVALRLTDANLVTATSFGSQLLDHISRTIGQLTSGVNDPTLASDAQDEFVYMAAHDINLYFVRVILQLSWQTPSYNQNMAPPGAMLGFKLLQDERQGKWYIKLYYHTQSMGQMRSIAPLNATSPPGYAPVILPECTSGPEESCPVAEFQQLVSQRIRSECVLSLQC